MARFDVLTLSLSEIDISADRRPLNEETVKRLAKSIRELGLRHPISVRRMTGGRVLLIAGRHRMEAVRLNGDEQIQAILTSESDIDARLWEIAENLHRADLTVAERAEQISEYARLVKEKRSAEVSRQVGAKPDGRPEGGARMAARELGITEQEVRRAEQIAGLSEDAKATAKAAGLDDNQSALLAASQAARAGGSDVAYIQQEAERREAEKRNRTTTRVVEMTEAERLAEWLMARLDLEEIDVLAGWLQKTAQKDVIAALLRRAA